MFHLHPKSWTDWAISEKGKVFHSLYSQRQLGSYVTQMRHCLKCGKTQIQTQRTCLETGSLVPDPTTSSPRHDKVKP